MINKVVRKIKSKLVSTPTAEIEEYHFNIDVSFNHIVSGWAYKKSNPEQRVHVAFKEGDNLFCEVMADQEREDLKLAGLPVDSCSFEVAPDLPQQTLTPVFADLYLDGIKVNVSPIVFSASYDEFIKNIKQEGVI
ncbi:hypothetical protein [Shewanella sp. 6_MG-2023]|uniref:hypothetical protein n=1 Tax=Shewanella sp. 6_MG-2023 TaxID=3062660 RepID=UPI0026E2C053|nr:hypothetical protein [Shewanella sp. 6_MG-2023]MDO6617629.1 hypothetical protein [Shewanella sp. 6_MG-2023]